MKHMKRISLYILLGFCFNTGIAQNSQDSVLVDGNYRSFYFKQPVKKAKKQTIIFLLHGSGGNGTNMMKPAEKLQAQADSLGYFLVYPNGYKNYWNECRRYATSYDGHF